MTKQEARKKQIWQINRNWHRIKRKILTKVLTFHCVWIKRNKEIITSFTKFLNRHTGGTAYQASFVIILESKKEKMFRELKKYFKRLTISHTLHVCGVCIVVSCILLFVVDHYCVDDHWRPFCVKSSFLQDQVVIKINTVFLLIDSKNV